MSNFVFLGSYNATTHTLSSNQPWPSSFPSLLVSFWLSNLQSGLSTSVTIGDTNGNNPQITITPHSISFACGPTHVVWPFAITSDAPVHFAFSAYSDGPAAFQLLLNGVLRTPSVAPSTGPRFQGSSSYGFGVSVSAPSAIGMADLYVQLPSGYYDLTDPAHLTRFLLPDGSMANLGTTNPAAFGFFSLTDTANPNGFLTNRGSSGVNLTTNNTLSFLPVSVGGGAPVPSTYQQWLADIGNYTADARTHDLVTVGTENFPTRFNPFLLSVWLTNASQGFSVSAYGHWEFEADVCPIDTNLGGVSAWYFTVSATAVYFRTDAVTWTWPVTITDDLTHIAISFADPFTFSCAVNGTLITALDNSTVNPARVFRGGDMHITASGAAVGSFGLADLYINVPPTYFDLSSYSTLSKLIDPYGLPQDLGVDARTVTNSEPILYLSVRDPHNPTEITFNRGYGGSDFNTPYNTTALRLVNPPAALAPTTLSLAVPQLPSWSQDDFTHALLDLLPSGRVWPKYDTSNVSRTARALIGSYQRDQASLIGDIASARGSADRATNLLLDTMPYWAALGGSAVTEMLPEWQATLGLPDPCLGETASYAQQIAQAVARFVGLSGISVSYIKQYAANLGYAIVITEYTGFWADYTTTDHPIMDDGDHVFMVTSPSQGSWTFEADLNSADDPLGGGNNTVLECELRRLVPAGTNVWFAYS